MAEDKAEKKMKMTMSVPNEPKSVNPQGAELLAKAKAAPKLSEVEADANPGWLISTNDHPEFVKYAGATIRVSPREKQRVADISLLPEQLPPGIHLKEIK